MRSFRIMLLCLQVQEAKALWDEKEEQLIKERNAAREEAAGAAAKLRQVDDAFRNQLDAVEATHQKHINDLTISKQKEIDAAMDRVREVEQEMTSLLAETNSYRHNMDERLRKAMVAFNELAAQ